VQQQIPSGHDYQKNESNGKGECKSEALWDDNQKSEGKSKSLVTG
jgi:hypothetical protein